MANIPVGLIGCGGRGRGHVRALHEIADVELVVVCDPVAANREQVGDEWGVERRYADVDAMLDAEELAAAIVATPGSPQRRGGPAVFGARHRYPAGETAGHELGPDPRPQRGR